MDDRVTVELADGRRFRVVAVEGGDGVFRPDVREVGPDGADLGTLVDAQRTDEEYEDARACLLGALARLLATSG